MATHFSILVWEIPWTEQPGGLQPMGSQRMGHDLVTKQQCVPDVRNALNVLTYLIPDNPAVITKLSQARRAGQSLGANLAIWLWSPESPTTHRERPVCSLCSGRCLFSSCCFYRHMSMVFLLPALFS